MPGAWAWEEMGALFAGVFWGVLESIALVMGGGVQRGRWKKACRGQGRRGGGSTYGAVALLLLLGIRFAMVWSGVGADRGWRDSSASRSRSERQGVCGWDAGGGVRCVGLVYGLFALSLQATRKKIVDGQQAAGSSRVTNHSRPPSDVRRSVVGLQHRIQQNTPKHTTCRPPARALSRHPSPHSPPCQMR